MILNAKQRSVDLAKLSPIIGGMDVEECLNNLWMEIGDVRRLNISNPLLTSKWDDKENLVENMVELCRDSDYLHFVTKYILNLDLLPFQCVILQMLWHKPLPMLLASRGLGKTFILAVYIILRMILHQGCRICVVGASLRQSMLLFEYVLQIWENAPVLQDICGGKKNLPKRDQHMCYWIVGLSRAVFLPMGRGDKIRGQRANIIIADEFSSISADVFQTVIQGFASVRSDNLHMNVVQAYKENVIKVYGKSVGADFESDMNTVNIPTALSSNQIIISGTPSYQFNHFYHYFKMYRSIISGDVESKSEFKVSEKLHSEDYCIIRIPYNLAPQGMMDEKIINQAKATMDPQIFMMEYGAAFPADSEGFYLASWLHACTCPVNDIRFGPKIVGDPTKTYVMSIDCASEEDNFAVGIIERNIEENYRGLVYMWTTNRKDFEEHRRTGMISNDIKDYNTFCIKHLRHLLHRFNIELIVMDAGGGGVSMKELFHDPDKKLADNDPLIYDMDDEMVRGEVGRHILKMIQFSNAKWRTDAHWGLQHDILSKKLLFPDYDLSEMELDSFIDESMGKIMDTTEDCYLEIEQCKHETAMIKHTQTNTGIEKWDIPKIMGLDVEQTRKYLKKDRFTALLLGNWGCRWMEGDGKYGTDSYSVFGMSTTSGGKNQQLGLMYTGRGAAKMQNINDARVESLYTTPFKTKDGRTIYK